MQKIKVPTFILGDKIAHRSCVEITYTLAKGMDSTKTLQFPDLVLEKVTQIIPSTVVVCRAIRDELNTVVDFQIVRCNEQATSMTELTVSQMTQHMFAPNPDGLPSSIFETYQRVIETGIPAHVSHYFSQADVWVMQSLASDGDDVMGCWTDITALKRAELVNQHQTELLRTMLDSSTNAVIAFVAVRDPNTRQITDFEYVAHNEANRRNMNGTDETILGRTLLAFFPKMTALSLFSRLVNVVESGEALRVEQAFTDDGWKGWYDISALKWRDGIVMTLVNITDSKTHQQALKLANRHLLCAHENLQQFARVASHDLQEPLRKIIAFGDILQEQCAPALGEHGSDMIARMKSAAHRMSDLIRDVLDYSRSGTHYQSLQSTALASVISDVQYEFQNSFELANLQLKVSELPVVNCDRAQMRQLFANLFANALKFRASERPASLTISCRTLAGAVYPRLLNSTGSYYEITLTDNGIGFDNKYANQIFQVFQRLNNRQQYPGTGVGLAICKRIVENHHGAITATATPGEGATFRVYLPK